MPRIRTSLYLIALVPLLSLIAVAIAAFVTVVHGPGGGGDWAHATFLPLASAIGIGIVISGAMLYYAHRTTLSLRQHENRLLEQIGDAMRKGQAHGEGTTEEWPELSRFIGELVRVKGEHTRANAQKNHLDGQIRNLQEELDQARANIAGQASASESRELLDAVPKAIYGVSLDGICVFCNAACVEHLGYQDSTQIVGRRIDEITPITDWVAFGISNPEEPVHIPETTFWKSDGTLFPVEYWALPLRSGDEIVGAVVTFIDITERKRAEIALYQAKEQAQKTLDSIGDAVVTMDAARRVRYLNPTAERLLGLSSNEAQGKTFSEVFCVVDEASGKPTKDPLASLLNNDRTGGPPSRAVLLRTGVQQRYVEPSASQIRDRQGQTMGLIVVFRDVSEARKMARTLEHEAAHDSLTGLANRREFERRLELMLTRNRVERMGCAILYLDLDQFKIVNDTCGHTAGDELLRQLAHVLRKHIRGRDTLARLGGDEFGVMLEGCPLGLAVQIADDMRRSVEEFRFVWDSKTFSLGVSIGLVLAETAGNRLTDVLAAADTACYTAKEGGRNRIQVYHPNDEELQRHHDEMRWVGRINHALEAGRLRLYSQEIKPISSSARASNRRHLEILVRMLNPDGSISPPGAFLPAAERYNLINATDRWVVTETARWLAHQSTHDELLTVSINLSGPTISDHRFLRFVKRLLEQTGVEAESICFEITETAAIANLSRAAGHISELKKLGFRFALDDFGSGLSSFGYLKSLPVDYLKIDGSFVKDIVDDPIDRTMVRSINEVGHIMGKRTIAEYVESDEVLEVLRKIGVDYAQGYGIAEPQPLATPVALGKLAPFLEPDAGDSSTEVPALVTS